jgi:PKD domain
VKAVYPKFLMLFIGAVVCFGSGCKKSDNTTTSATTIFLNFDFTTSVHPVIGWPVYLTPSVMQSAATSFLWDYGDGSTSDQYDPTHAYTTIGTYTVTLTVNGDKQHAKSKAISIGPNFGFYTTGVPVIREDIAFHFLYAVPTGGSYFWDFGDGATLTTSDSIAHHTYLASTSSNNVVKLVANNDTNRVYNNFTRIYKDPLYTHLAGGMRLWHGNVTIFPPFGASTTTARPDSSFALTVVDAVTIEAGSLKLIYVPDSSKGNVLFFQNLSINSYPPEKVYYDYVKDSIMFKFTYQVYPSSSVGHPPPTHYNYEWHAP